MAHLWKVGCALLCTCFCDGWMECKTTRIAMQDVLKWRHCCRGWNKGVMGWGMFNWDVVEGEVNEVGIPLKEGRVNHSLSVGRAFKVIMGLVHISCVK